MFFWWKKKPPEPPAPLVPATPLQIALPVTQGDQSRWWVQGSDETVQRFSRDRRDEEVAKQLAQAMQSLERQNRNGHQGNEHQLQNYIHKLKQTHNRRRNRNRNRHGQRRSQWHGQSRVIDVEYRRTR